MSCAPAFSYGILSTTPTRSARASLIPLRRWRTAVVVPNFSAIAPSVSPCRTVYVRVARTVGPAVGVGRGDGLGVALGVEGFGDGPTVGAAVAADGSADGRIMATGLRVEAGTTATGRGGANRVSPTATNAATSRPASTTWPPPRARARAPKEAGMPVASNTTGAVVAKPHRPLAGNNDRATPGRPRESRLRPVAATNVGQPT